MKPKCYVCHREMEEWLTLLFEGGAKWLNFCSIRCLKVWVKELREGD